MALSAIGFADDILKTIGVALDNFHRVIRRTAIDEEMFEIGVFLVDDGKNGFFDELPLIEGRGDDRDFRPGTTVG